MPSRTPAMVCVLVAMLVLFMACDDDDGVTDPADPSADETLLVDRLAVAV